MKSSNSIVSSLISTDGLYEYTINDNEVTIVNYLGTDVNIILPETIDDYPVTIIGECAFINNINLSSIVLSSVTTIHAKAFTGCKSLTSVLGDNVLIIDSYGFYNCEELNDVKVLNVKSLGQYCFASCYSLESISLPLVSELPPYIFNKCYILNNFYAPNAKNIGDFAFESCKTLEQVDMPEASAIGFSAFSYSGIKTIDFSKVIEVNYEAFLNCYSLEKVNLPVVNFIDDYAFMNSGIKCLYLSKNLVEVGIDVFTESQITGLTIDYGIEDISSATEDDWYAFANKLSGLNLENIIGRYIENNLSYVDFSKTDTEAPVIILSGDSKMTLEVGLSTYVESGAIVNDNSCGNIPVVISGSVDTSKIGKYILNYSAIDNSGNKAIPVNRTVDVVDTTAPVITLNGANPMNLEVGLDIYNEPGAQARDNSGEFVRLSISGSVNAKKVGQNTITYTSIDSSGNKAEVFRIVNVIDTIAPLIAINGANPMNLEVGLSTYTELGATISDHSGEVIEPVISGEVDTSKKGQYYVTYTATDSSGNQAEAIRTINVVDTTAPIITLFGPNPYYMTVNKIYEEPGTTVTDNSGEKIASSSSGNVDVSKTGQYNLTYNAVDSSGNKATPVVRTVKVVTNTIIKCSKIIVSTNITFIVQMSIISMIDGKVLYISDSISTYDDILIDFAQLNLSPGAQVRLKAIVKAGGDKVSSELFEYEPSEDDICANYKLEGASTNSRLYLLSVAAYYYKCRYVNIYNGQRSNANFIIYTTDDVKVIEADNRAGGTVTEFDLSQLHVITGTKLKIHGINAWALNRLQYDESMNNHGWFDFWGQDGYFTFAFTADEDPR